ncbi:hypothetical protein [Phyllobacterium zundukense]|uniref:DUF1579 domain-containing protein n=1 Tax=Phyllobacterium zundukense TaxID=1867719 RepID=A0A2N9W1C7_9HYPH|nr:hypothetical protein [Phyllobacterium zundukense]ATU91678.1 hypothetical protein BLM14_08605 [Phyllobacterium zundukense]PIO45545.1 hypothetical protein B5P45_05920 [Phyllobacterium zundukense]
MKKFLSMFLFVGALAFVVGAAPAEESAFLKSLEGKWAGTGTVKVRTNSAPLAVSCRFDSSATDSSLALDGNCRGLIVISRTIGADLKFNGATYTGSYTGAGTGKAGLIGSRRDDSINLDIRWAKNVNGDRNAQLVVQKVGNNGMKLTTVDVDPLSGKTVVTSEINLQRQ